MPCVVVVEFYFFFPRRSPIACPRHVGGVLAAVSRFDIEWLRPLRAVSCLRFLQYPSLHIPSSPMFAARCGVTATAFFGVTTTRAWLLFIVYIKYNSKACPAVRFCFLFSCLPSDGWWLYLYFRTESFCLFVLSSFPVESVGGRRNAPVFP